MNYFVKSIEETEKELNTSITLGLTTEEVKKRQEEHGFNKLEEKKKESIIVKFLNQFKDFMIIILIIAAVVSGIVGVREGEGFTDTIIIMIVVIVNAIIGVIQEDKAEKSLEALQKMSSHVCKVIRNGNIEVIEAADITIRRYSNNRNRRLYTSRFKIN